jgi:hypothetical protein
MLLFRFLRCIVFFLAVVVVISPLLASHMLTLPCHSAQPPRRAAPPETMAPSPASNPTTPCDSPARPSSVMSSPGSPIEVPYRPGNIIGKVMGRTCILVDDVLDGGESFASPANTLMMAGARQVVVMVTHGVMSGRCPRIMQESVITEVVVTNSIPQERHQAECDKLRCAWCLLPLLDPCHHVRSGCALLVTQTGTCRLCAQRSLRPHFPHCLREAVLCQ